MGKLEIIPYPAVNAAILNSKGEILLTRRSGKIREPGKWCLPGGHVDGGESWTHAMAREVREEVGLKVEGDAELLGIYSDPKLTVSEEPLPTGALGHFLTVVFLVRSFSGDVKPNDEVDKWGWYALENLPTPMLKSHPIRVEDAFKFNGQVFVR